MTTLHTKQLTTIHTRHLKIQHVQKVNNTKVKSTVYSFSYFFQHILYSLFHPSPLRLNQLLSYCFSVTVVTKVARVLMIMQLHQTCLLRDFSDLFIVVGRKRIRQGDVHSFTHSRNYRFRYLNFTIPRNS